MSDKMRISLRTGDITSESHYIKRMEGVFEELMKYAKMDVSEIQDKDSLQTFLESAKAKGVETGGLNFWIQKTDKYQSIIDRNSEERAKKDLQKSRETEKGLLSEGITPSSRNKRYARKQGIVYLGKTMDKRNYAYDFGKSRRVSYKLYSQIERTEKQKRRRK